MTHRERATELFMSGYSCAQSVLGAYADDIGMDEELCFKLSSSFGGGMGRLREVCGAVSSMFMIAGIVLGFSTNDQQAKKDHYAFIQHLAQEFKIENSSIICRDLLSSIKTDTSPIPDIRTAEYYKKRPCVRVILSTVGIIEKEIFNRCEE